MVVTVIRILIALIVIGAVGLFAFYVLDPTDFGTFFKTTPPPPDVKFFDNPTLSDPSVHVHTASILTFTARNYEKTPVSNVTAFLSVTNGANPDADLQFSKVTQISDSITSGDISPTIHIPIHTIDMSGISTTFQLKLQLQVNGVTTDSRDIGLTIIP